MHAPDAQVKEMGTRHSAGSRVLLMKTAQCYPRMRTGLFVSAILLTSIVSSAPTASAFMQGCLEGGRGSASCYVYCEPGNHLAITVTSHDSTAKVEGDVSCGGLTIHCGPTRKTCTNEGGSTRAGGQGFCQGWSHEFWPSQLTVKCEVTFGPPPPPPPPGGVKVGNVVVV